MIIQRLSLALGLCITACGDDEPTAYEDMSFEQRRTFMEEVVLPEMREVFVAFDPKFADMTCATCHGEGAADGTYAMPSPQIPPLPDTEEGFFEYIKDPEHARWSQFMQEDVWPDMAELLQVDMFEPMTRPDGFSCSNCHTHTASAD